LSIQQKYNTPQAEAYRQRLTATVEGKPLPSMPKWNPSCLPQSGGGSGSHGSSSSGAGDSKGVEALKGESEQDYVARQMRLKEEARARMQAKFGAGGLQGIGSGGETAAPSYNAGGGITDLSSAFSYLSTTVTTVASTAVNAVRDGDVGSKVSTGWSYVQNTLTDPTLTSTVKSTAATGWSTLSSGANAVWKTAQTVVETAVNSPKSDGPSNFPRTNPTLSSSGKYAGMGGNTEMNNAREHDNDNWLDAQLSSSSSSSFNTTSRSSFKSNSFGNSSSTSSTTSTMISSKNSNSFSNSRSSTSISNSSSSLSTVAPSPASAPAASSASSAPAPAPAPTSATKKKEVDFFGEYGF
jgi:ADP-ribosylation factor GTPase-activating protein 1